MSGIDSLGDVRGKRVLVRSDLNVPLDSSGGSPVITDDGRVRASVPTIRQLSEAGAVVVVCAHLGRPKGAPEAKYSLAPVAARLQELLGRDVTFVPTTVGPEAQQAVAAAAPACCWPHPRTSPVATCCCRRPPSPTSTRSSQSRPST